MRASDILDGALQPAEWSAEPALRARFSCDCFHVGTPPLAVIAPRRAAALAAVLPRLAEAGIATVPCGALLSYSAGALPVERDWIAVDLRQLDAVLEINAPDGHVRVQAGCTWQALRDSLRTAGLRTPFWGPASGKFATVGGTLSNNAIFFGSSAHGSAADSVLGLTVLLANGELLHTGTHATDAQRATSLGPDFTALFVGACGAFGIIVEASLPLLELPRHLRSAGFECRDSQVAAATLTALARAQLTSEVVMLGAPGSVRGPCQIHLTIEAHDAETAAQQRQRAIDLCVANGAQPAGDGLLGNWHDAPFGPPAMLRDAAGRRWVPVHGLLPHSRLPATLAQLDATLAGQAAQFERLGLTFAITCALVGRGAVLVEVNLFWNSASNALLDSYLGDAPHGDANIETVAALRTELGDVLDREGASHLQLGRHYSYLQRLDAPGRALALGMKRLLDPQDIMNPGVLQLWSTGVNRT
jgi:FAD/FMN-containing dehydrogenase